MKIDLKLVKARLKQTPFQEIVLIVLIFLSYHLIMGISLLVFPLPEKLTGDFSTCYHYNNGSLAWINLNREGQFRVFTPLKDLPVYLKKGVVEYEDRFFFLHPGFNPGAICRALYLNLKNGRIISGGSTITMQLARLVRPVKRSFPNKLLEFFRSLQLEVRYSKNQILELYLNTIPMGSNIQGVEAASFFYFGKTAKELTFSESCLLLSLSNAPNHNRPDLYPQQAITARNRIAGRLNKKFKINRQELDRMLTVPVPNVKNRFKSDIIPLVERFSNLPHQNNRYLTVDPGLQSLCLNIIRDQMSRIDAVNGAMIVVDNHTKEVLVYIGSPFYEAEGNGVKFNAANIYRSPGSTLKPFIYARALEEGLVSPKKSLYDIPMDFSGYQPKNFTNNYYGIISADEALYRSLNLPAIYLEKKLSGRGIQTVLNACNLLDEHKIGKDDLSVVLGSYPLTLENVTELYGMLADQGKFNKLTFFKKKTPVVFRSRYNKDVLSPQSAFIISQILSEGFRPDLSASWEFSKDKPRVAFKTGTSYGLIDAWTVGYTPSYTVGVWVGNLDNKFTRMLTGISVSAPILFKVFNELNREKEEWFTPPKGVGIRKVCAVSGMVPQKYCTELKEEYFIPGKSSPEVCSVHKRILINRQTRKAVSLNNIDPQSDYEEQIAEIWPEEVEFFFKKYGKTSTKLNEGNYRDLNTDQKLTIVSPDPQIKYVVNYGQDLAYQKIALFAYDYPDSRKFHWYANGQYLGNIDSSQILYFLPHENKVNISVVDEAGRTAETAIRVDFIPQMKQMIN